MGPGSCPRHASTTTAGQHRQLFPARPAAAEPHPLQHHGAVPGSSCGWITFGSFSPRSPHQDQLGAESPSWVCQGCHHHFHVSRPLCHQVSGFFTA